MANKLSLSLFPTDTPLDDVRKEINKRLLTAAKNGNPFRPRDVEPLLDQASRLLDIAAAERLEWENLRASWIDALRSMNDIQFSIKEYTLRREKVMSERTQLDNQKDGLVNQKQNIERAIIHHDEMQKQLEGKAAENWSNLAGGLAENSMLPLFKEDYKKGNDEKKRRKTDNLLIGVGNQTIDDLQRLGTIKLTKIELMNRLREVKSGREALNASLAVITADIKRVELQYKVIEAEATSLSSMIEDRSEEEKAYKIELETGLFEQMRRRAELLIKRYEQTRAAAYLRLMTAYKGVVALYRGIINVNNLPQEDSTIDELFSWTRDVGAQLAAASRNIQDTVLCARLIPVPLATGGSLASEYVANVGTTELTESLKFIGVRGISITANSDADPTVYAKVHPPGWTFDDNPPIINVSRIAKWGGEWLPEVFGTAALYNWLPSGAWRVFISQQLENPMLHVNISYLR